MNIFENIETFHNIETSRVNIHKLDKNTDKIKPYYSHDPDIFEIGVDEAGRGPLFGRVYTSAVILPKNTELFDFSLMKDSKRFHSKKKINDVADYIKKNAVSWSVTYADEKVIDDINILQATQLSMHNCILDVIDKRHLFENIKNVNLLIDGNYFNQIKINNEMVSYVTIEGGDNKYASIAAASILAKVERDKYIDILCAENPELIDKYALNTNKGYGVKKHIEGIKQYGITQWHRKYFGICKNFQNI
jgi:ribonuclease HII